MSIEKYKKGHQKQSARLYQTTHARLQAGAEKSVEYRRLRSAVKAATGLICFIRKVLEHGFSLQLFSSMLHR